MLKNRHALKKRNIKILRELIENTYSCKLPEKSVMEIANLYDMKVILVDNSLDFIMFDDKPLFILKSIEKYKPLRKFVVVDRGAIPFITNGADVMIPGIVDADVDIKEGDPIWVKEDTYGKPIAVGISMKKGTDLVNQTKGKGVKNIHWIGDRIWKFASKTL